MRADQYCRILTGCTCSTNTYRNVVAVYGAGIHVKIQNDGFISVSGQKFINTHALIGGGAVFAECPPNRGSRYSSLLSKYTNTSAGFFGGGLYIQDCQTTSGIETYTDTYAPQGVGIFSSIFHFSSSMNFNTLSFSRFNSTGFLRALEAKPPTLFLYKYKADELVQNYPQFVRVRIYKVGYALRNEIR